MAGHSHFANIKHRKEKQGAKRAKLFTKLIKEVYVAASQGLPEIDHNPKLRTAVTNARKSGVPKDKIEDAIKKASSGADKSNYEEIRYEGYGPGGVAIVVEALTDNKNRTASDVRAAFNKFGGSLGETGSVSFMFNHIGFIEYDKAIGDDDTVLEAAIMVGADECESNEENHVIMCSIESFNDVRDGLTSQFGDPNSAKIIWDPQNITEVDAEKQETIAKLIDALEDSDDVQEVYSNHE